MAPSIVRIERLNYVIGGIVVLVAAVTQPQSVGLGVAIGVGLTCLNFFVLRRLVVKWTADAAAGKTAAAPFLMMPKMILLMGAVVASLAFLPIDPVAFIVGYSIFILSIMIETQSSMMRTPPRAAPTEEDHG